MLTESVVLYFPNTESLADFLIENNVGGAMVNTNEHSLTGELSEQLVQLAYIEYEAYTDRLLSLSF
ncbi:MAG: hypothetical protein M3342_08915 [Bacteroidota bacterium]|nr:hypothetical protein [Bacteroidota bacterium]